MLRQPALALKYCIPYQILSFQLFNKNFGFTEYEIDELHFRTSTLEFLSAIYYSKIFNNDNTFMRHQPFEELPTTPEQLRSRLMRSQSNYSDTLTTEESSSSLQQESYTSSSVDCSTRNEETQISTTRIPEPSSIITRRRGIDGRYVDDLPSTSDRINVLNPTSPTCLLSIDDVVNSLLENGQEVPIIYSGNCDCTEEPKLLQVIPHERKKPFEYVIHTEYSFSRTKQLLLGQDLPLICFEDSAPWPSYIPFIFVTSNALYGRFSRRTFIISRHSRISCIGANVAGDRVSLTQIYDVVLQHAF